MTLRNPLFEFMPYGAPELLAAQRPQLLRALVLASGLALMAFLALNVIGLSLPRERITEFPLAHRAPMEPPPSITPRYNPTPPRVAPSLRSPQYAIPVPVPETTPIEVAPPSPGANGDKTGEEKIGEPDGREPAIAPNPLPEEVLPDWRAPVYVDELPVIAKIIKPEYPDLPRELGITGKVYVHMLVGKDGRVMRAEIDDKFSEPMFDQAALDAARKWVFTPGMVNGHPVPVWVGEMFVFTLNQ